MDWKKFALTLTLMAGGTLALLYYVKTQQAQRPQPQPQAAQQAAAAPASPATATAGGAAQAGTQPAEAPASRPGFTQANTPAAPPASAPAAPVKSRWVLSVPPPAGYNDLGSDEPASNFMFMARVVNEGAAVEFVKLSQYFQTVQDKMLWDKDPKAYAKARLDEPNKYQGRYLLMSPVNSQSQKFLPMATKFVRVTLPGQDPLEWRLDQTCWRPLDQPASSDANAQTLSLEWTLYEDTKNDSPGERDANFIKPFLSIIKTYTIRKGDYSIGMSLSVRNHSGQRLVVELDQSGPSGLHKEDYAADERRAAFGTMEADKVKVDLTWDVKKAGSAKLYAEDYIGTSADAKAILWVGDTNKFFASMMYVMPTAQDQDGLAAKSLQARFYTAAADESSTGRTWLTGAVIPQLQLEPNAVTAVSFDVFAGPKKRDMFIDSGAPHFRELYKKLDYVSTIDFGGCWFSLPFLTLGMMWLLQKLAVLSFGNYGVAIMSLVLLVRIVLFPLTRKSQMSMMKMQKLAPEMEKLKKKYGDDKEGLQKATMQFYKTQGASPFLGCLPMFLQMPILIALYTSINASVELRHAAFLPVWLTDLAAPDKFLTWTQPIPLLGTSLNLLPVLLCVATLLQMKLNPSMAGGQATPAATPEQAKQQKMMGYMMPFMMLLMFYSMASGLTLYFMASTFIGVGEQFFIRRHVRHKEAMQAAVETTISVPGRGMRGNRPKKSKGPFWTKRG